MYGEQGDHACTRAFGGTRRAAIIAATLPLLLERGATVSAREIAEAAGIAEGTIFGVFPDKEALTLAVSHPVLFAGAPMTPREIVTLLLNGIRAADDDRPGTDKRKC